MTQQRGEPVDSPLADRVVATVHPSSILRQLERALAAPSCAAFVDDLRVVAGLL